jgi:asparagine synthase (glutamine-hydrolysing)
MCGIAGQFGKSDREFSSRALRLLGHRGPDSSGLWLSPEALLIHTRLAIIETGSAGRQPMALDGDAALSPDEGKFSELPGTEGHDGVIVFNGEIYNHRELRGDLESAGVSVGSGSDTEVLMRLFAREGSEGLIKLAGMFAFAFWHGESGTGYLVRDPLGIKPLYYRSEADGSVSFASEAKVLQRQGDTIDASALRDFFLWGSLCEPATLSSEVRALPAGHLLQWEKGRISVRRWAPEVLEGVMATERLRLAVELGKPPSYEDSLTLLREALRETVSRHMVSDVPIGFFLSGGIDSTVLLSMARSILGPDADLRTFSIAVDDPSLDESGIAARTARHFGARHTEWRISSVEFDEELPRYLAAIDQPSIDGFNTWCASKLAAREGIKVVLSGLGGDEIFGGYTSFRRMHQQRLLYRNFGRARTLIASLINAVAGKTPLSRLGDYFHGGGSWLETYHSQRGIFLPSEAAQLALALGGVSPPSMDWRTPVPFPCEKDAISFLEISRYMRNQLLRDSDVFSMAHGLELRVPFVDARLLSRIQEIPPMHRFLPHKRILTDAVGNIPDWILGQPKRGFSLPFQSWIDESWGDRMKRADALSPVPLRTWYRRWAVVVADECLKRIKN